MFRTKKKPPYGIVIMSK